MNRLRSAFRLLLAIAVTFSVAFFVAAYVLNATGLRTFDSAADPAQLDGHVSRPETLSNDAAPVQGVNSYQEGDLNAAIGLNDNSVFVLRKQRGIESVRFYRGTPHGGEAGLRHLAMAPKFDRDVAAIKLADGRVLVTGVYSGGPGSRREMQFWLYDPRKDVWQATGGMNHTRVRMAFAALPDGRAFVAGGSSDGSVAGGRGDANNAAGNRGAANRSAEIWDPRTEQWEMLPPLPLSFKINAYNATAPSAAVLPDGSLVVGGGMHRHIVLLRARGKSFAPYWTIAGSTPGHRVGGVVQALGNNAVAVLAGVAPLPDNGGCCRRQPDGDRIAWTGDGTEHDRSLSLERKDAAVAHRGDISFAAGGWETFMFSSQETQASAVAELIDHRNGRVRTLPPLAHPLLAGRAIWLDDDRVLVKAVTRAGLSGRSFHGIDDRSLEHDPGGFLAIYSMRRDTWSNLEDARIASATLVGITGSEVVLMSPDARVWAVNSGNFSVRELPRPVQARNGGVSRILPDGRIVVAGGMTQSEVIQAIDADCGRPDCPLRDFGYGGLQPSRRYEVFDSASGLWRLSAASQGAGESATIRRDGRVVKLGRVSRNSRTNKDSSGAEPDRLLIEESNATGSVWRSLPLPSGLNGAGGQAGSACWGGDGNTDERCTLLIGERPDNLTDVVFLLLERWDHKLRYDLWVLADDATQWISIARDMTEEQLFARQTLPPRAGGKAVYASSFQPHKLRIWVE